MQLTPKASAGCASVWARPLFMIPHNYTVMTMIFPARTRHRHRFLYFSHHSNSSCTHQQPPFSVHKCRLHSCQSYQHVAGHCCILECYLVSVKEECALLQCSGLRQIFIQQTPLPFLTRFKQCATLINKSWTLLCVYCVSLPP